MVSICIPYNEDRGFLKYCLASIYGQSYQDLEVIEVNSPESVAINVNIGLKQSKGEYFKFVGEDDWLPSNSIKDLVDGIKDKPWVIANAINAQGRNHEPYKPPLEKVNLLEMATHNVIHGGTTLYRTEILREIGGMDETLWTGEEYELNLRLLSKGYSPGYVDSFVYYYRVWGDQKSRRLRRENRKKRANEIRRIQSLYIDKV
jgi:GT2 family glycosyltransferase